MTSPTTTPDPRRRRGADLVRLVIGSQSWVHRRVERLELEPDGSCRRHVSLDFTVPVDAAIAGSRDRICVPLGLAVKGPLHSFSVTLHSEPVSLLETQANGALSLDLLMMLARNVFGDNPVLDQPPFEQACRQVVFARAGDERAAVEALAVALPAAGPAGQVREAFLAHAERLAGTFLLTVEIPAALAGTRTIVKYSYQERASRFSLDERHPRIRWQLAEFGLAASVHFEFEPPPVLCVAALTAVRQLGGATAVFPHPVGRGDPARVHMALRPGHRFEEATVDIELAPRREGVALWAINAALATFLVLLVAVLIRWDRHALLAATPVSASPAGALLAFGSVLLTWVARSTEDRVVSRVLARPRWMLWLSAIVAAGLAALLAVPLREPLRTVVWVSLLVGQGVLAGWALRFRRDCQRTDVG